ncbi:MAG: 50S ribosomal protein L13 [Bacteriovoracaceae bacterium]|nr:50S ribosomal protein L13 [Bacteriovoracaceae bacterium]
MYAQRTFVLKPANANKKWHLIDAENQVVGRLATVIADLVRGKSSPQYTPHTDSGDFVVVINADKVKFTGNKWDNKKYYSHSRHVGSLKTKTAKELLVKKPTMILMHAVQGMLPKSSLGRQQLTKVKVFAGADHTHEAQKPEVFKLD